MVFARKWQLMTPISMKAGTFDKQGQKKELHDWKLVPRYWVEQRNSHDNNEWYEVDEEMTADAMVLREKNIRLNEEKREKEAVSTSDLVGAIAQMASKHVDATPETNEELESAREMYKELFGKRPHHATKLATITDKIAEKQAELNEED